MQLTDATISREPFEVPEPPEGVELGGPIEMVSVPLEQFDDRWKCLMCRTAERICDFHQSMEADGYKPPLNFSNLL